MANRPPEDVFQRLWGQAPSDEERRTLLRLRDALGIDSNDALWTVLIALRYHLQLYEAIPERVSSAAKEVLDNTRATADATIKASTAEVQRTLVREVSQTVRNISNYVYGRELAQWIAAATAVICIVVGAIAWHMHSQGEESGYAQGYHDAYQRAQDEKAAAAWANTPEGQRAYRLARLNSLTRVAECSGAGWKVEDGICYPYPTKEKIYGWRVAED